MFAYLYMILLVNFIQTAPTDVRKFRDTYHQAIYSEKMSQELLSQLNQKSSLTPIERAYLGATQMLMAQYAFLPNQKYTWFSKGKSNLEEAIKAEPKNAESIYLRYSIQLNVPSFLGYSDKKQADKVFLLQEIKKIKDKNLQDRIKLFLQKEASLNEQERALLP